MALKRRYEKQSDIPEKESSFYVQRDGAWHLDADVSEEREKLNEFRENNTRLMAENERLLKQYEGIDPAQIKSLIVEKKKLEEEKKIKAGEVESVIEGRILEMRKDLEAKISALEREKSDIRATLSTIQIDKGILTAAARRGIKNTAVSDILARAKQCCRLDAEGKAVVFSGASDTLRMGSDGVTPMSLDEWVDSQVLEAPHLFESNVGGGAAGNGSGGAGGNPVKNPFRRDSWNLTEQMKLIKNNPALAAAMKSSA